MINLKVSPQVGGAYQKLLKYDYTVEFQDKNFVMKNETHQPVVLKSEAWMHGTCSSDCPGNCTGGAVHNCNDEKTGGGKGKCESDGRQAGWYYVQKARNPADDDITVEDRTLKTLCKRKNDCSLVY